MSHTLSAHRNLASARAGVPAKALPYWNPYLVGFLLGLVLLATYAVSARGLGATAAFAAVSSWLVGLGLGGPRRGQRRARALLERRRSAAQLDAVPAGRFNHRRVSLGLAGPAPVLHG
jgi:hypothetical protein